MDPAVFVMVPATGSGGPFLCGLADGAVATDSEPAVETAPEVGLRADAKSASAG
ncbi:MAG: hypothetical protein ACXWQ5_23895 [Ktedonobacterales bacterium]